MLGVRSWPVGFLDDHIAASERDETARKEAGKRIGRPMQPYATTQGDVRGWTLPAVWARAATRGAPNRTRTGPPAPAMARTGLDSLDAGRRWRAMTLLVSTSRSNSGCGLLFDVLSRAAARGGTIGVRAARGNREMQALVAGSATRRSAFIEGRHAGFRLVPTVCVIQVPARKRVH